VNDLPTKSIQLDGGLYKLTMLATEEGLPIYSRLIKALGPVARGVMNDPATRQLIDAVSVEGDSDAAKAQREEAARKLGLKFVTLITEAVEHLPTEFLVELAETFTQKATVVTKASDGLPLPLSDRNIYNQHFAGRYMLLTRFVIENVKLNYSDFLASLVASAARAQAASA
jgi:hypothetical protein